MSYVTSNRLTVVAILIVALAGCTAAPPSPTGASRASGSDAPEVHAGVIARPVDIGDGRQLYLECRGSGSPTVVFVSGTGGAADEWMSVANRADPSAVPTHSTRSVFDIVARTSRVCAYDRPGTTLMSGADSPSTLVPQPTTAGEDVADLHALLTSAHDIGPAVLVGASWGGMIAQLYARMYQQETRGIILVDSASVYLRDTFTVQQWTNWIATIDAAHAKTSTLESPNYEPSVAELQASPTMPHIPAVVLSSDQPWDLGVTPGQSTWPMWLAAQSRLAVSLDATHISDTGSGHGIAVEQPDLVATAIGSVVEQAR